MQKTRIRFLDIIFFILIAATGIFLTVSGGSKKGSVVSVNANGNKFEYSAEKDGVYQVEGALGITTFEIKGGRVRITDSPCPNKTCISQGYKSPLVCLPNKVIITVEEEGEFDALSE